MSIAPLAVILLFIKQPAAGRVKSRIAAVLGEPAVLTLYRNFILDILETSESTGIPCRICVHPPDAVPAVASWLGDRRTCMPQIGNDLGERMENAFRAIFAEGIERAVLIGSDIPDLPAPVLHEAFDALGTHDAVIGPAQDGGYYLIGFPRQGFVPDVFRNMTWSASDVFDRTMQVLGQHGASVKTLRIWQDVDTIEDLRSLAQRNRATAFAESRTMSAMRANQDVLIRMEAPDAEI